MEFIKNSRVIELDLIRTGDLLFTSHASCVLSQAIDFVTQTDRNTHYSHIGITEKTEIGVKVYHSTPKRGVCFDLLDQFIHCDDLKTQISVYRLKQPYIKFIPEALNSAKGILGEQYNHSFRITEPGYYCSEFIYRIFAKWNIFQLNPMTFRNPGNGEFIHQWIEYYKKLGVTIPERQPGCNPNGLAASDKIEFIGDLKV